MLNKLLFLLFFSSSFLFSKNYFDLVCKDYDNFYSYYNIKALTATFVIGGMFASSPIDEDIASFYQSSLKNNFTDKTFGAFKIYGNWEYLVPVYLGASLFSFFDNKFLNSIGRWGEYTLRTYIVGVPLLLLTQRAFGASRPIEPNGSAWHFFADDNAVSGHSMMGSIPFLVLANMIDNNYISFIFYIASTFPGLSRINDNMHYFSQVAMGWIISYISVKSVFRTEEQLKDINIFPIFSDKISGIGLSYNF